MRAFRIAYALFLLGVFAYFVPAATWSPVSRFALTRAIVEQGTLTIDGSAEATGDRAFRDGHYYSDKAPFPSLLAVPPYALVSAFSGPPQFVSLSTPETPARHVTVNAPFSRGLYVCSLFTAAAASVALALLVFEWIRRRSSSAAALAGSLFVALGTPLFPYATSFYGHAPAAAFLFGAFFVVTDDAPSRRMLRVAGACLALAVGCEYVVAVPCALVAAYAVARARRVQRGPVLFDLFVGALGPVLALAAYHTACFGAPWRTGYSFLPRAEFAAGHARGFLGISLPRPSALLGLSFGSRRGLFFVAPVALVGLLGLFAHAIRRDRRDARLGAAVFVLLLAINAGYYMWWGGAATGPRHLVPVMAFLALGVAFAWERPRLRSVVIVLGAVSVANMLVFTAVGLEVPERGNALFDYAYPRLFARKIAHLSSASNLGLRLGLPRHASLAPLLLWMGFGARFLVQKLREATADAAT